MGFLSIGKLCIISRARSWTKSMKGLYGGWQIVNAFKIGLIFSLWLPCMSLQNLKNTFLYIACIFRHKIFLVHTLYGEKRKHTVEVLLPVKLLFNPKILSDYVWWTAIFSPNNFFGSYPKFAGKFSLMDFSCTVIVREDIWTWKPNKEVWNL